MLQASTSKPMRSVLRPSPALAAHKAQQANYLPKTSSLCAQVAAMHNYSSPSSGPVYSASVSARCPTSRRVAPVLSAVRNGERCFKPYPSQLNSKRKRAHVAEAAARAISEKHSKSISKRRNQDIADVSKRAYHNVLERKRRHDLQASIQELRKQIPDLTCNERAPKMTILKQGASYCKRLAEDQRHLLDKYHKACQRNKELQDYLDSLKKLAAGKDAGRSNRY